MSFRRALILILFPILAVAVVPASLLINSQLVRALDSRLRDDLNRAPMILKDRWASTATVRMMHARDFAGIEGVGEALARGRPMDAVPILQDAVTTLPESPVLLDSSGTQVLGQTPAPEALVDATRMGEMPVEVVAGDDGAHVLALAPVKLDETWVGAAGGSTPLDAEEARALAGLTRSEVVILTPDGVIGGSTMEAGRTEALHAPLLALMVIDSIAAVEAGGGRYLASAGSLAGGAKVFFLRDLDEELAIVPSLQRTLFATSAVALVFALVLTWMSAAVLIRPVDALAAAADRLRAGDQDAPVPASRLTEVNTLASAFRSMRESLAARLHDLETANVELADRQERLAALQAELVQRERSQATGQLVSQLAHEIRNPIASIRNCLEVIRRHVDDDDKAAEFADLAIEELLRMHELTERTLAMSRPKEEDEGETELVSVAREVAHLVGVRSSDGSVSILGEEDATARIPADALKQVLLNLVLNAREAGSLGGPIEVLVEDREGRVAIQVLDRGPGIDDEILPRIFDPFYTTKEDVQGVGLGLFTSEAIVRRYGGRIEASNRDDGPGARFEIELPAGGRAKAEAT